MKDKFKSHFEIVGNNIRRIRIDKNWTQEELANRCSVNREKISRIENAQRDYMHSTLLEVCAGLEVDILDVLTSINPQKDAPKNR